MTKVGESRVDFGAILQILIYVAFTVSGLFLMKVGSANVGVVEGQLNINITVLKFLGMFFYICSFLLWMTIIQKYNLSYIFPVATGLVYITVFIVGVVVLKEAVSIKQTIASILIIIGIVLMMIE